MRKVLLSLLVLAMAAPAMAVTITPVDNGDGTVSLVIDTADVVRGLALKVTCSDGAKLVNPNAATVNAAFNTFIDYAFTTEAGAPGTYAVGDGHPFADAGAAGVAAADDTVFSISMGVLDQNGGQAGYTSPAGGEVLITFETGAGNVCFELDTLRGGIVGNDVLASNLDGGAVCKVVTDGPACLGDLNGDGMIDLFNDTLTLILALDAVDYVDITPVPAELAAGDMDGNGVIDLFNDTLTLILMLDANDYIDIPCAQ